MATKKKTRHHRRATAVRHHRRGSAAEKLQVHIRDNGDVDFEVVNLRKNKKDEVVWHADNYDFTITFADSPFTDHTFFVAKGGTPTRSGAVRPDVVAGGYYAYDIASIALAKSADPGVNVKP